MWSREHLTENELKHRGDGVAVPREKGKTLFPWRAGAESDTDSEREEDIGAGGESWKHKHGFSYEGENECGFGVQG